MRWHVHREGLLSTANFSLQSKWANRVLDWVGVQRQVRVVHATCKAFPVVVYMTRGFLHQPFTQIPGNKFVDLFLELIDTGSDEFLALLQFVFTTQIHKLGLQFVKSGNQLDQPVST